MRALPYRVPSTDVVKAEGWMLDLNGDMLPMPEAYPHWDYQTIVTLRRTVFIDLDRTRAEAGLGPETDLALAVVWTSTGSKLKGTADRRILTEAGKFELQVRLPGSDLGGILLLDTALVLAERRSGKERPTAARRAGSVLWSDRHSIRLQGDAPQFPMAIIDFDKTYYPADAAWHLELGSLETATMGSLILLVNQHRKVVAEALQHADRPRPQDRIVLSMLEADVARTMIEHALQQPEFTDDVVFPDDSLGATIQQLFERLFPGRSVRDVRLKADQSPSWFGSEVQAALKLFEGFE